MLLWEVRFLLVISFIRSSHVSNLGELHSLHVSRGMHFLLVLLDIFSLSHLHVLSRSFSSVSRKLSQVSQFPAKSPDSRKNFVFLPKQTLLELSPPVDITSRKKWRRLGTRNWMSSSQGKSNPNFGFDASSQSSCVIKKNY